MIVVGASSLLRLLHRQPVLWSLIHPTCDYRKLLTEATASYYNAANVCHDGEISRLNGERVGITSADWRVCWAFAGVQVVFQSHRWRAGWLVTRFEEMISKASGVPEVMLSARMNRGGLRARRPADLGEFVAG